MIIGLFELIENINQTLATNLTIVFYQYKLRKKFIAYVKDESLKFNYNDNLFEINC
jgi:hypothetical protein